MKKTLLILSGLLLLAFLGSCTSSKSSSPGTSLVTVTVGNSQSAKVSIERATMFAKLKNYLRGRFEAGAAYAAIPSAVKTITVAATAADMTPIVQSADVSGMTDASITIEVPNGQARNFLVDASGPSSALYYSGGASADLTGEPVDLTVTLSYVGALLYVANSTDNTVSVINAATEAVIATVPVGTTPTGVAINTVTQKAYIANFGSSNVSVIDIPTNTATTVTLSLATPYGIAVDTNNDRIYVSDQYNGANVNYINGIDNSTGIVNILGSYSYGVAVNPKTNIAYVADWGWANKIDTTTNLSIGTSISISGADESAFGVAIDPSMNITIVTDSSFGSLNFIDAADAVTTIAGAGISLEGVVIDQNTHLAYIADSGANSVLVVNLASKSVTVTIPVGGAPKGIAYYAAAKKIFVSNSRTNTVSVIDAVTKAVLNTITVGNTPLGLAVSK